MAATETGGAAQTPAPAPGAAVRPLLMQRLPALNGTTLDARLVEVTYAPGACRQPIAIPARSWAT